MASASTPFASQLRSLGYPLPRLGFCYDDAESVIHRTQYDDPEDARRMGRIALINCKHQWHCTCVPDMTTLYRPLGCPPCVFIGLRLLVTQWDNGTESSNLYVQLFRCAQANVGPSSGV